MTAQKLFNRIAEHLRTQGRPALDEFGDCVYRGPNGLRCAIGAVIPDYKYRRSFEARAINALIPKHFPRWKKHKALLSDLQELHDIPEIRTTAGLFHKRKLTSGLRVIARKHSLEFSA